ncbi:RecQ family ATP-dependent DNA helicase [Blastopirellula sp. JC732]|uniref:RecQ family ATP-dependent DNA helicase n=1 Tax=Blastopirellula sediminis TaxID=2894196 RepID=A0A9X1SJ19_9BACT|nr:RecQ family ATP-dependent DNA helicase [Blastopirellula sediminis]MCC9608574.1 RecQ family ATP-dependent DNA helicase [Blastopirellula sediminis]MCC9628649.1 RecQ family ATP-dependent DNA helicase [Blastopirellula sediminis]
MISNVAPENALRHFYPDIAGFRDCQREAIDRLWKGESTLLLMPTGMGKSLAYQLPVLASGKVGVVISPLIALMQQQAANLIQSGANVLSLGGATDARQAQDQLKKFRWDSGAGFLFVSPERMETDGYIEYLLSKHRSRISLLAIDESHCISQWGHDFRPPYKCLPGVFDRSFGRDAWPTVLCLTATLDETSQGEILNDFRLNRTAIVRSENMLRTNLDLSFTTFKDSKEKHDALEVLLEEHRGEKVIVYAHRIKSKANGTRALSAYFEQLGHRCKPFDAALSLREKDETISAFQTGEIDVVFATGAFGMGVDIPDIRGVVHYLLPESIEQYYQEVGRAGRDQKPAFGRLLYCNSNGRIQREMIESALREPTQIEEVWNSLFDSVSSDLKSINPWTEFQGKEDEYALFYAFVHLGAIKVLARGPAWLKPLSAVSEDARNFLRSLSSATRTGSIARAIRKLGLDPQAVSEEIFRRYDSSEIKLTGSLDKTIYFRTRQLRTEEAESISEKISKVVESRLNRFDEFLGLVETKSDPTTALAEKFGG